MIIQYRSNSFENDLEHGNCIVLLFGCGLVGSAIAKKGETLGYTSLHQNFSWDNIALNTEELKNIIRSVESTIHTSYSTYPPRINIILSAGKAGFNETEAKLSTEENVMLAIIDFLTAQLSYLGPISTHLFSSAGGIFEGASYVDSSTPTSPQRPYGLAKLRLEDELIRRKPDNHSIYIYRPSTIYGYAGPKARHGLITMLLQNAVSNHTTHIFAGSNTLRDYVSREDIAAFTWKQIHNSDPGIFSYNLASGKPTSILEVINKCELVLNRAVWVNYSAELQNSNNISFSKSCIAPGFNASRLIDGITNTFMNIKNYRTHQDRYFA